MSGLSRFRKLQCLVLSGLFILAPGLSYATDAYPDPLREKEYHYILGLRAYKEGNFRLAIEHLYRGHVGTQPYRTRSELLLADSYAKVDLKTAAVYYLDRIDANELESQDLVLYDSLKVAFKKELEELNSIHSTVFPYVGLIAYGPGNLKYSSAFFGAYGEFNYQGWQVFANGVQGQYTFQNGDPDSYESQITLGLSRAIGDYVTVRGMLDYLGSYSGTLIAASNLNTSTTIAGGIGGTLHPLETTYLGFDYYFARLPTLLSNLVTMQYNISLTQYLYRSEGFSTWITVLGQLQRPSSSVVMDQKTGFRLKSSYERYAADLEIQFGMFQVGLAGWYGSEAFGIRNQGIVIYNSLEEHRFGYSGTLKVHISDSLAVSGTYGREAYLINGPLLNSNVVYGGLYVQF